MLPNLAEVRTLIPDAVDRIEEAGFDPEIFYAVSWQAWPNGVKMDVNTGSGKFNITYMVGEHWSPKNRGYDIVIEDEVAVAEYVTPGNNDVDFFVIEDITVKDKVMNFHFIGNPATGKGDLNAMFSGLIIEKGGLPVESLGKLAITWGEIKK